MSWSARGGILRPGVPPRIILKKVRADSEVFGLWRVRFPPCLVRPGRRLPVQGLSEGSLGCPGYPRNLVTGSLVFGPGVSLLAGYVQASQVRYQGAPKAVGVYVEIVGLQKLQIQSASLVAIGANLYKLANAEC